MPYRTGPEKKTRLPILDRLSIKTPCDVPWEEMVGDDQVRYCCRCNKDVYDLSRWARDDAETFLARYFEDSGELPCARLYRRPDGRVLTAECARGERLGHLRRVKIGFATAAAIAAGLAAVGDHVTTPRLQADDDFLSSTHDVDGHLVFDDEAQRNAIHPMHAMAAGGMSMRDEDD